MSTYESDPAGLGVGKRYGPLAVGGLGGELPNAGIQKELVFEFTAGEVFASGITLPLPAGYVVEDTYLEVGTAFAATSTFNISIDGGGGLTTAVPLHTLAAPISKGVTGLANPSGQAAVNIVATVDAAGIASAVGYARFVVRYKSL